MSVSVDQTLHRVEISTTPPAVVTVSTDIVTVTAVAEQGPPGPPGASSGSLNSIIAGDGLDGGGSLASGNVTISVDSSVARVGGVLWLDESNNRVGINQTDPKVALHVGGVGLGDYTLVTSSTTPNQIADEWSALDFRSAKYQIQTYSASTGRYEVSELLMIHNGSQVFLTEYAVISEVDRLTTFNSLLINNQVRLLCTPTYAVNTIKVFRTLIGI